MEHKETIAFITPGGLPVPSVKGGGVQNLIEHLIDENEKRDKFHFVVFSPYDEAALKKSKRYEKSEFVFIKTPIICSILDKIVYKVFLKLFDDEKAISFKNNFKLMNYAFRCARYLRTNNYDKIIIENNVRNFWCLKLYRNYKKYENRYYLHLHNVPKSSCFCKKIVMNSRRVLCVSKFVGQKVSDKTSAVGKIAKDKIIVFKNCIDVEKFRPNLKKEKKIEIRKKLGLNKNDFILIFSGRITREKGISEVVEALSKIKDERVKLLIVGACYYDQGITNKFESDLIRMSKEQKERIFFTGYIDYDEMSEMYQIADVAILPSVWDEPAGLTMIEAAACGIPVISTVSGGIPEYLKNNSAILLKRDENLVDNIALNVVQLMKDKKLYRDLATKGRRVAEEYNTKVYYKEFKNIMEEN